MDTSGGFAVFVGFFFASLLEQALGISTLLGIKWSSEASSYTVSMARTGKSLMPLSYHDTLPYLHQKTFKARQDTAVGLFSRQRASAGKTEALR